MAAAVAGTGAGRGAPSIHASGRDGAAASDADGFRRAARLMEEAGAGPSPTDGADIPACRRTPRREGGRGPQGARDPERTRRVFSSLKRRAMGVPHGLRRKRFQRCPDGSVFRCSRRHRRSSFGTLPGTGLRLKPATYRDFADGRA